MRDRDLGAAPKGDSVALADAWMPAQAPLDLVGGLHPMALSIIDLSLRAMQDAGRAAEQQIAVNRAIFDAWLCLSRRVSDAGREAVSPARISEWLIATAHRAFVPAEGPPAGVDRGG